MTETAWAFMAIAGLVAVVGIVTGACIASVALESAGKATERKESAQAAELRVRDLNNKLYGQLAEAKKSIEWFESHRCCAEKKGKATK